MIQSTTAGVFCKSVAAYSGIRRLIVNRIQNDYGEWVLAAGAQNSRSRVRALYPKLIESLKVSFDEIPVLSVIELDLVDRGFDKLTAKLIAQVVDAECCHSCASNSSGPSHFGSQMCKSGSIASGGTKSHCSCDVCF